MLDLVGIVTRILLATPAAAPVAASAPAAVAAPALTAVQVVDSVQLFYKGITQVTASFRQSVVNATFGTTKESDGKIYVAKPGQMRWDYFVKAKGKVSTDQEFVTNGTTLWAVNHATKQIYVQNIANQLMPVAVAFLTGTGNLNSSFTAAIDTSGTYGTAADTVVVLTPKTPSAQYKTLTLVVSTKDFHVSQSIIVDASNDVNQIRFFTPNFKAGIQPSTFTVNLKSKKLSNYSIVNGNATAPTAPAPAKTP